LTGMEEIQKLIMNGESSVVEFQEEEAHNDYEISQVAGARMNDLDFSEIENYFRQYRGINPG